MTERKKRKVFPEPYGP